MLKFLRMGLSSQTYTLRCLHTKMICPIGLILALLNALHIEFFANVPYLSRTAGVPSHLWDQALSICKKTLEMLDLCYAKELSCLLPPFPVTS